MNAVLCQGSLGPPGESWPGMAPRRACPTCGAMLEPEGDLVPHHEPADREELQHLEAAKQSMLYIVFTVGTNWRDIRPLIFPDLEAATAERERRLAQCSTQAAVEMTGITRPDMARVLAGLPEPPIRR